MNDPSLRYVGAAVTQLEVPDEVSLTIAISNCPYRCPGCHSSNLWADTGKPLLNEIDEQISPYEGLITCVCLMGEGRNPMEVAAVLRVIRARGMKTCLYSGSDTVTPFEPLLPLLDYIKLGAYYEAQGGLDSPQTNQRFYCIADGKLIDKTHRFERKKE